MTKEQYDSLPKAQQEAMRSLQERSGIEWDTFLEKCYPPNPLDPYVGVPDFHGMFVGIEPDGYTHS